MEDSTDDGLRRMVRDFHRSVSNDLTVTHRQMNALSDEVRTRITTAETAILNAVRGLGRDLDSRPMQVEQRMAETDARLNLVEDALRG